MTTPDLQGFQLTFIETTGVEVTSLIFQSVSDNLRTAVTHYLHMYQTDISSSEFICAPYFPATQSIEIGQTDERGRMRVHIDFADGHITFECSDISHFRKERSLKILGVKE